MYSLKITTCAFMPSPVAVRQQCLRHMLRCLTWVVCLRCIGMEEAELLADRIGVLNNGELRAYGTPLFLKHSMTSGSNERFRVHIVLADKMRLDEAVRVFTTHAPDARRIVKTSHGDNVLAMVRVICVCSGKRVQRVRLCFR